MQRLAFAVVLLTALCALLVSCGGAPASDTPPETTQLTLAPESALPEFARGAPPQVREAYRFAAANPEVLKNYPCYCGCSAAGHRSNLDCYIKEQQPDGTVVFDDHAFGCTLCVDITRDVMRLMREGKGVPEIRGYVEATYSKYGPSTGVDTGE